MTTRLPHPTPLPFTPHITYSFPNTANLPSTRRSYPPPQHLQDLDLCSLASLLHHHFYLLWDWLAFVLLRVELWALGMLSTCCTTEPIHPPQHKPTAPRRQHGAD